MPARVAKFFERESAWELFLGPLLIATSIYWNRTIGYSLALSVACFVAFLLPYPFRTKLALNYPTARLPLASSLIVLFAGLVALNIFGHAHEIRLAMTVYYSLVFGIAFWPVSDPVVEMLNWLLFPTEYGELPDEIHLIDGRPINWAKDGQTVYARLYRFRYGDEWNVGITGPITFSLGDQDLSAKSPEEIYEVYGIWHQSEGIARHFDHPETS